MVVAQLTITPRRRELVRFTIPTRRQVNEVVVTGPGAPALNSLEDLSGRELFVRRSSSYYDSLMTLNTRLEAQGRPPAKIRLAPEHLQDDDVLEMVNAGLVPITVVDDYLAQFWAQVFTTITVHDKVALRTGGDLAVAVRKDNPALADELNQFIGKAGLDTATGAILNKKYLQSTKFVKNATSEAERRKFLALIDLFRRYGNQYQFDYLLLAAQGYQESRLDQNAKSAVGAIGVMQLMPETGREQQVGNITKVEPNVHAGVKYMRFIRNMYFENEPMDQLNKGAVHRRGVQRRPGTHPPAATGDRGEGPEPEHLVRQCRTDCVGADRPGDSHLREQHLQYTSRMAWLSRGWRRRHDGPRTPWRRARHRARWWEEIVEESTAERRASGDVASSDSLSGYAGPD